MPGKLKVYCTAIGFHDAYVAAASQKAALEAWGTGKPLFARGAAEIVTDPELTAEPLASPGKVVKRLRGTAAEQMAALPPDKLKGAEAAKKGTAQKPSRVGLDQAERAIEEAGSRHEVSLRKLADRETTLRQERRAIEEDQARELERLDKARDAAAGEYKTALDRWRG